MELHANELFYSFKSMLLESCNCFNIPYASALHSYTITGQKRYSDDLFLQKATAENIPTTTTPASTTLAPLPTSEPTSLPSAPAGGMPGTLGGFLQVHGQVSVVNCAQWPYLI